MRVIQGVSETQKACREIRLAGKSIGFVPTMGALHEGHLSLVRASRAACDVVVASIFVNPLQFGPSEDFDSYPRTPDEDIRVLEGEGVEILFTPAAASMYPVGTSTRVEVAGISDRLDGASRPGHFRGVTTVVAKLFHIVGPTHAFFGQKDAVQVAVLQRMVRDLSFDLQLVICPIAREADGLALSSRNRYLSAEQKIHALALSHALHRVEALVKAGETLSRKLKAAAIEAISRELDVRIDYVAVVDTNTLEDVDDVRQGALVAVAAWVGETRLIDNVVIGASDGS